jgi:hypothetical protein
MKNASVRVAEQPSTGRFLSVDKLGDVCGHIIIGKGACYKCLNSGNSLGCS